MKIFLASSISFSSVTIRRGILSESSRAMRFLWTKLPKMCRSLKIDSVTAQSSKALWKVWFQSRLKASVIPSFDRFSIF